MGYLTDHLGRIELPLDRYRRRLRICRRTFQDRVDENTSLANALSSAVAATASVT